MQDLDLLKTTGHLIFFVLVVALTESNSDLDVDTATLRLGEWEEKRLCTFDTHKDVFVSEAVLYLAKQSFSESQGDEILPMINSVKNLAWVFFRTSHSTMITSVVEAASMGIPRAEDLFLMHREVSNCSHRTAHTSITSHKHLSFIYGNMALLL